MRMYFFVADVLGWKNDKMKYTWARLLTYTVKYGMKSWNE